ncbi:MAG: SUMF1/EgtB/PvdO family nonheme iron enzyme [Bacteroidetes bacterium]|nr:SUMF1/EgtB/PvdO family nonheme iron enzyme [Bacteroidota bacterium]
MSRRNITSVGHFKSNALGLFDMSDNVYEWCSDWFEDYFTACISLVVNVLPPVKYQSPTLFPPR